MRLQRREPRAARADTPTRLKISALDLMSKEFSATSRSSGRASPMPLVAGDLDRTGGSAWESRRPTDKSRAPAGLGGDRDDRQFLEPSHPDSFRSAIELCVAIGQCFSLLPTLNKHGTLPRFKLASLRVLFWAFVTSGLLLNGVLSMVHTSTAQISESTITVSSRWMFYLSATTVSVLYFRLARQWRGLCRCFLVAEREMQDAGHPPRYPHRLGRRLRLVTVAVLSIALIEYTLAVSSGVVAMDFTNKTFGQILKDYYCGNYEHMLLVVNYHPVLLIIAQTLNTVGTFMWNFNDLFVMLTSISISQLFRLLNNKMSEGPRKMTTEDFWKSAREKYNALSVLTREVDQILSAQILFSFMNNLYFICIQLLHTVKHEDNSLLKNVYFTFSFGFLIMRTVFVSLFAASINDESKNVKKILYSVSSKSYCDEVDRFIIQATTDEIALTGLKFFNVTRSFLLTMAGTIATYEVVLVQFNGNRTTT